MSTVADRLRDAIEEMRPRWSINRLHRELSSRGVRGSSYGSLRNYINGRANPPLEFLLAAADALGVSEAWLIKDEGERTQLDSAIAAFPIARPANDDSDLTADPADLEKAFRRGLPALDRADSASWHALGQLYAQYWMGHSGELGRPAMKAAFARVAGAGIGCEDPDPARFRRDFQKAQLEAAKHVAAVLGAGASKAGVDLSTLSRWHLDRYIQVTAQALSMLFHGSRPGPGAKDMAEKPRSPRKGGRHGKA